jgi:hypothetical protein
MRFSQLVELSYPAANAGVDSRTKWLPWRSLGHLVTAVMVFMM